MVRIRDGDRELTITSTSTSTFELTIHLIDTIDRSSRNAEFDTVSNRFRGDIGAIRRLAVSDFLWPSDTYEA